MTPSLSICFIIVIIIVVIVIVVIVMIIMIIIFVITIIIIIGISISRLNPKTLWCLLFENFNIGGGWVNQVPRPTPYFQVTHQCSVQSFCEPVSIPSWQEGIDTDLQEGIDKTCIGLIHSSRSQNSPAFLKIENPPRWMHHDGWSRANAQSHENIIK